MRDQIDLQVGGDGLFLTCANDDPAWREPSAPAVWMNNLFGPTEYPGNVVLCLKGFAAGQPITVTAAVGADRYTTTVTPIMGPPPVHQTFLYEALPSETLFDSKPFDVYSEEVEGEPVDDRHGELLVSETWTFLPPGKIRSALAHAGRFAVTARQGSRHASSDQRVHTPSTRALVVLDRTGSTSERRAVVLGYRPGAQVPIGLYRRAARGSEQADLVRKIATLTIPATRVAELGLEDKVRHTPAGFYCVAPPVDDPISCDAVDLWPDYPGSIERGDRGKAVKSWQRILIQAGVISDIDANHDGYFGPATARAVESYLANQNLSNPDGDGSLGRGMYKLITG